jgi:ABC-type branched-subunit amino acid transport system substrate-binding protein
VFGNDTDSGKTAIAVGEKSLAGAGFNVIFAKGVLPPPPISDYTPYVQQVVNSDSGHAPDAVVCLLAIDCISMYKGLTDAGFTGAYYSSLYTDLLLEAMKGSYAAAFYAPFDTPSDGLADLQKYLAEVQPDAAVDLGSFAGWASTDMFIQALKAAAQSGGISPENVHDKAMSQTWEIKGFAGPTNYPDALAHPAPACSAIAFDEGTAWKTVVPYACSDKTFPIG